MNNSKILKVGVVLFFATMYNMFIFGSAAEQPLSFQGSQGIRDQSLDLYEKPGEEYLAPNGINFGDLNAYTAYVDSKSLPRIMLVGSGRGPINYSSEDNYANKTYSQPFHYFLVDIKSEHLPDLVCNVKELGSKMQGENIFSIIIFECISIFESFNKEAIGSALTLLKPGGRFVTNNYYGCINEFISFPGTIEKFLSDVDESDGKVNWNDICDALRLCFKKAKLQKLPCECIISFDSFIKYCKAFKGNITLKKSQDLDGICFGGLSNDILNLDQINEVFLDFFGEDMANSIGNIEFEAIEQGTKLWPKSETEILLEQGKP
ncbi:MAG: hypothetical protein LBS71_01260, partial [Puniceicoccales bacterium]|nr:hypothetical protein [Puniceicoccales bacterium]